MKSKKPLALTAVLLCCIFLLFTADAEAAWKNCKGGKKRYYITKTTYAKSNWYQIKKKWYYFDANGYLKSGRFKVGQNYYYCQKSSGRVTNKQVGKYFYGPDGKMVRNKWKKIKKYYFYFGSDGQIRYGRFTIDGKTYYCSKKTGRVTKKRVGSYYYDSKGVMVKDRWVNNFYYGSNGKVKIGKFKAKDGNYYYCDKIAGKLTSQWKNKNYYGKDGAMAVSCWIKKRYVNEKGVIIKGDKNPPSASDIRWLAAITYLEAGNQSYYGKKCVASVVMNRVKSKKFPNTIKGVLFQSGQFTPAMNGSLNRLYKSNKKIQSQCVKAATYVLENGSVLKNYYHFNNFGPGLQIGDHYFS